VYKKIHLPSDSGWQWSRITPFASTIQVDDLIYVSGQNSIDDSGVVLDPGNISAQTRNVFERMKNVLASAGAKLTDLVRLNTYYVFDGEDKDATMFWENMTRVRLEYFPDPGPAATAVRVKGMPYPGQLIQIEGIAVVGKSRESRVRVMPKGHWDWSIPVPLSQGWKVGNRIFVGGQISADCDAKSVAPFDIRAQTQNVYNFIQKVVLDAGANMEDLAHVKICYKAGGEKAKEEYLSEILSVTEEFFRSPGPAVTAFGVDLLYPGLVLEIDAMGLVDPNRRRLTLEGEGSACQSKMLSDGWHAAGEIYVSGQNAMPDKSSLKISTGIEDQAKIVFQRIERILASGNIGMGDITKLNLFFLRGEQGGGFTEDFHKVAEVWEKIAPSTNPSMTAVQTHGLPADGLLFQADCIAINSN